MCRCVAGMSNHLSHHHRYGMTVILETPFAGAFVSDIFGLSLSSPAASFVSTLQGWVISFQHHRSRLMSVSVAWSHISLQTIIHYTDNRNRRRCRTSLSCESYLFLIQQQNEVSSSQVWRKEVAKERYHYAMMVSKVSKSVLHEKLTSEVT